MTSELISLLSLLLPTGVVAGFIAGLFGLGGGVIMVPALLFLFTRHGLAYEHAMAMAVSTSLSVILPNALSSSLSHYRLGNMDLSTALKLIIPVVLGVILASQFVVNAHGVALSLVFACVLWFVAFLLVFPNFAKFQVPDIFLLRAPFGFILGLLSGMAGVGGGALGVPILMSFGLTTIRAVGTAASFGLMVSMPSVIAILIAGERVAEAPFGSFGLINVPAFLVLSFSSVFFAPIGAKVASKLPEKMLKTLFCILLVVMGARIFLSAWS